ncbi:MAG: hypothetical protein AAF206_16670 [Bacteroidota bacterium]
MSSSQLMNLVQKGELLDAISLLTVKHQYKPIVVDQLERVEERLDASDGEYNQFKSGLTMLIKYADQSEEG